MSQYILIEMVPVMELPYCVYGSPIIEYEGNVYGRPFEAFPAGSGVNMAIYGDRLYYSTYSGGTSEVSTALYSCKLDGSDVQLLDKSEFIDYSIPTYDCSEFTIYKGTLYYAYGERYIDLSDGYKGTCDAASQDKAVIPNSRWRYDSSGTILYYFDSESGEIIKSADGKKEVIHIPMTIKCREAIL